MTRLVLLLAASMADRPRADLVGDQEKSKDGFLKFRNVRIKDLKVEK